MPRHLPTFFAVVGSGQQHLDAQALMDQIPILGKQGRLASAVAGCLQTKATMPSDLRQYCDRYRTQPVIPQRTIKRKLKPGLATTVLPPVMTCT